MYITQLNMEQFNRCNYENFQNIGTLHRNFAYTDPFRIMRIIRILRMLGILKCKSSSKSKDNWNDENNWNYRNIWNFYTFTKTLPTQTPVE